MTPDCPFCHLPTLTARGLCTSCGVTVPSGCHPGNDNERYKWQAAEQVKARKKRQPPAKADGYRPEEG